MSVQKGSTKFRRIHQGSKGFRVQEESRGAFNRVQEGLKAFNSVLERSGGSRSSGGFRRFQKRSKCGQKRSTFVQERSRAFRSVQKVSEAFKRVQKGSRAFKRNQEGSAWLKNWRGFITVQKFQIVHEGSAGSKSFTCVPEASRGFKTVHECPKVFRRVQEGS